MGAFSFNMSGEKLLLLFGILYFISNSSASPHLLPFTFWNSLLGLDSLDSESVNNNELKTEEPLASMANIPVGAAQEDNEEILGTFAYLLCINQASRHLKGLLSKDLIRYKIERQCQNYISKVAQHIG